MANCAKNAGKLRPIVRTPVTFKYELKVQIPADSVKQPPHYLYFHCHHSPTDKIFKGRELRNPITLVRPRVDSNLVSEQCF